ncbi:MAG: hypothetical protein ACYCSS_07395 [Sulfuriferula sp.]
MVNEKKQFGERTKNYQNATEKRHRWWTGITKHIMVLAGSVYKKRPFGEKVKYYFIAS